MAEAQITIECGFCLRKDEELPSPKTLPCTHVHCLQCLTGYYMQYHMLICPTQGCGKTVVGSPDTLTSYSMGGMDSKWCDACMDENMDKEEAVTYCTVCSSKFCEKHLELHDKILRKHKKISMEDYRAQCTKVQIRTCTKHSDQPYTLGCRTCLTLVCLQCFNSMDKCDNGTSHDLLPLEDLVAALMKDDISTKALAKEEQYEKLCKETSKVRADYDNKTTELVQLIHQTRDTQLNELKLKYQKMEDELMEKRQQSSVDLAEFMEEVVLKKWTQLMNCRKMVESRMKCSHQVDIVKGFKELKEEIHKLVVEELPKLQLSDELQLKKLDVNRAVELEVVSSCDIVIDCEGGTTPQPLPQAIKRLKSVQLPARPFSVCQYNGSTYVGLDNYTVTRIDNNYQLYNSFISTSGIVESISVYKARLYTLSFARPHAVDVYDMSGGHITSWTHPNHDWWSNMLTVVADQVVIADPPNQRITVYSLTGESLRHIPCPLPSDTHINMCAVDNTSVVISNYDTSKVFRVNITTGDVMWTFSDVNTPLGLVRYGCYILLAAHYNKTIYILDITTGEDGRASSHRILYTPVGQKEDVEFYYDFMDRFVDREIFAYLEMDTDSGYMALSEPLYGVIKPDMRTCLEQYGNWFPRLYCDEHCVMFIDTQRQ